MTTTNELDGKKCCYKKWRWTNPKECKYSAKVMRDGKPYCNIHDPEKRKARDEKWSAKWKAQRAVETAKAAECRAKERIADAVIAGRDAALPVLLGEYRKAEAEHKAARRALADIEGGA